MVPSVSGASGANNRADTADTADNSNDGLDQRIAILRQEALQRRQFNQQQRRPKLALLSLSVTLLMLGRSALKHTPITVLFTTLVAWNLIVYRDVFFSCCKRN